MSQQNQNYTQSPRNSGRKLVCQTDTGSIKRDISPARGIPVDNTWVFTWLATFAVLNLGEAAMLTERFALYPDISLRRDISLKEPRIIAGLN